MSLFAVPHNSISHIIILANHGCHAASTFLDPAAK
jgi:hypothetical protein